MEENGKMNILRELHQYLKEHNFERTGDQHVYPHHGNSYVYPIVKEKYIKEFDEGIVGIKLHYEIMENDKIFGTLLVSIYDKAWRLILEYDDKNEKGGFNILEWEKAFRGINEDWRKIVEFRNEISS